MRSGISRMLMLLMVGLLFGAPHVMAQGGDTGGVTGAITNPTGAGVPNVTVTLTDNATGVARTTTTGTTGAFGFDQLPPDDYSISFSANGFRKLQINSFTVNVGESPTINRVLQAGQQNQPPIIEARAENTQSGGAAAATGGALNAETVTELPLATRNITQEQGLNAGSNAALPNATTMGTNQTDIAAGGAATTQNNYMMDGVPVNTWSSPGNAAAEGSAYASFGSPNPDAIQELKVDTSNIDASFGRKPGAHVNVITKAGGNDWHGTAFEFFRNTALNANDFFREENCNASAAAATLCANGGGDKLVLNQNQFGGSLGGPVKKDKLFFFGSYQQTWQKNGYTQGNGGTYETGIVLPPFAATAGTNNYFNTPGSRGAIVGGVPNPQAVTFENSLATIYSNTSTVTPCPVATGCYPTSGYTSGAASTGVQAPGISTNPSYVDNINPAALAMLQATLPSGQYYMPGSVTGVNQNTNYGIPGYSPNWQGIGNLDYIINPHNTLSGRYFHQDELLQGSFAGLQTTELPGDGLTTPISYQDFLLRETAVLSSHTVNEVRWSWQHTINVPQQSPPPSFNAANIYTANGIPVITSYGATSVVPGCGMVACSEPYAPEVTVSGTQAFTLGGCSGCDSVNSTTQMQWADNVSWTHGKHSIRFGYMYERIGFQYYYYGITRGIESFTSFPDFLVGLPGNCGGFVAGACNGGSASNINSTVSNSVATGNNPLGLTHHYRVQDHAAFIADDWKVTKNLTLTLGLRWEFDGILEDKGGEGSNMWISAIAQDPYPVISPSVLYQPGTYYGYGAACVAPKCLAPPFGSTYDGWIVPANFNRGGLASGILPAGVTLLDRNDLFTNATPLDNFGPRLGFAWSPLGSNKLVLRAGFGYFYDRSSGSLYTHAGTGPPQGNHVEAASTANSFASETDPYANYTVGTYPSRWINPAAPGTATYQQSSNISDYMDNLNKTPLTYSWNMSLQYELRPTWSIQLGYQGSHGIDQNGTDLVNADNIASVANPIVIPGFNGGAATTITTNTNANAELRVPYLGFSPTGINLVQGLNGYKFQSLQATLRHTMSHGLSFSAAYTLAKAYITTTSYNYWQNRIYIPNTGYRPQRVSIRYSWNIPGSRLKGFEGKLLGGWSIAGTTTIQDGTPLIVTDNRGGSIYGVNGTQLATAQFSGAAGVSELTSGAPSSRLGGSNSPQKYFNTGFFTTIPASPFNVAGGTLTGWSTNSSPGSPEVLGPGEFNFDASLTKTMVVGGLRENARLQFRTEFYNMFNHPQFSNPGVAVNASSSFGVISSDAVNPRLIQFGLKYMF